MAGHNDGDSVAAYRAAYGLRRHARQSLFGGDLLCNFAVCHRPAVWNGAEDFPYLILKVCACEVQRHGKIRLFPRKVNIKPLFYFFKNGEFPFLVLLVQIKGKIFLPLEPEAGQANLVGGQ